MVAPGGFTTLLLALGLTQVSHKPVPNVGHWLAIRDTTDTPLTSAHGRNVNLSKAEIASSAASPRIEDLSARDGSCGVQPYNAPPVKEQTFPPFDRALATVYRYRQQQSVNLGSWFVHESWMTPSLFKCAAAGQISELDIAHGWGSVDSARSVLEQHWDTFINETDFQYLSSIGINTVRLPIGYWNLGPDFVDGTPYSDVGEVYENSWPRIVRTINIAGRYGIGVLVDLHGAVGSQNGHDHSGVSDGATRLFDNPDNIKKTIAVLTFLTKQLVNVSNVVGIQILNEPNYVDSLEDFYTQAISAMRVAAPGAEDLPLYLHDGFQLDRFSKYVAKRTDFVVQDHHSYFVFTPSDQSEPASGHTADVQGPISSSLANASGKLNRNLVVDEWSCALTEQSLQGEKDPAQAQRDFCTGQMEVYANTSAGWSFWAYRKEGCNDDLGWCFGSAVGNALPSTFFTYGVGTPGDPSTFLSRPHTASDMFTPPTYTPPPTSSPPSPEKNHRRSDSSKKRGQNLRRRKPGSLNKRDQTKCSLKSSGYGATPTSAQPPSPSSTSPAQRATKRGYSDGYLTAKIFSQFGTSKLGFTGQYIRDSIRALGTDYITPGNEGLYSDSFMRGLSDGEHEIGTSLKKS